MFSCECCEISKNTFFTELLRTTASEQSRTLFFQVLENNFSKNIDWWLVLSCSQLLKLNLTILFLI